MKRNSPAFVSAATAILVLTALSTLPAAAADKPGSTSNVLLTIRVGHEVVDRVERVKSYEMVLSDGGDRSEFLAGSRVPIPTTTFQTSTPPQSIVPMTAYTYQNVGFTVQARAWVQPAGTIVLEAQIEDSHIAERTSQPTIETRQQQFRATLVDGKPIRLLRVSQDDPAGADFIEVEATVLR